MNLRFERVLYYRREVEEGGETKKERKEVDQIRGSEEVVCSQSGSEAEDSYTRRYVTITCEYIAEVRQNCFTRLREDRRLI